MIHEDIELSGSFEISGSLTSPKHASDDQATAETGSIYHNTTDNVLKVYTGTEWVVIGDQARIPVGADIEYLVVAGGGGAGFDLTAGGGAGGLLSSSLSTIESGSSITVTVGAGGAGYTTGGVTSTADGTASSIASAAGTAFTTVSTVGGGGGSRVATTDGRDGGSGGGCGRGNQGATNPGSGTVGQGNDGGADSDSPAGTGGGGAGAAGSSSSGGGNPATGGAGGAGKASSITGTSTSYAGGGGGGGYYGSGGAGGTGGGGTGGTGNANNNATNGTANTGGGAGGGEQNATVGRSGGSGVVILAYNTGSASGLGGIKTINGGRMVHTFNSSGTLTIAGVGEYPVANRSVFTPVIWTGNSSTQAITGVGFQPDMVWIKNRSHADNHYLLDSVRGKNGGSVFENVYPNLTNAQANDNSVTSLDSDGFTLNSGDNGNDSGDNFVAWCWKAGGSAVSNTDGDITSTVSANQDAGFSIVKFTGNGGTDQSVGHGLSSAPELVIFKRTDAAVNWFVFEKSGASTNRFEGLNTTNAATSDTFFTPSDSTITWTGSTGDFNGSSKEYIMYCFHSVDGYQKVGTYEGTGTSGNSITTGFEPKFVLIKNVDGTGQWMIYDAVRDTDGTIGTYLVADSNAAEATAATATVSPSETGFTLGNSNSVHLNKSGNTFMYLAVG